MKINFRKYKDKLVPSCDSDYQEIQKLTDNAIYVVDIKKLNLRTQQQNKALHLWCKLIADELNANNIYLTSPFSGAKLEYTSIVVKEHIIKATIKQMFNLKSTTKLTRKQIDELIDYITIIVAKFDIVLPEFPNKDSYI